MASGDIDRSLDAPTPPGRTDDRPTPCGRLSAGGPSRWVGGCAKTSSVRLGKGTWGKGRPLVAVDRDDKKWFGRP
jgi:hypothetical protein